MRIAWQVFAGPYVCLEKRFRNRRGIDLIQDVLTSHTAHTTLSLLQARSVSVCLGHQNRLTLIHLIIIWDVVGRVVRRWCLANEDNLHVHVQYFVMDGWEGISQRMLNV